MGRIAVNDKPRHPSPCSPPPGPPVFLDAKDRDLPYDGQFKQQVLGAASSYFEHPLGLREEGALLLAVLTGVQGSPLQKLLPGTPGWDLLHGRGREAISDTPRNLKGNKKSLKLDLNIDGVASMSKKSHWFRRRSRRVPHMDEAVGTEDLAELTGAGKADADGNWLFESAEDEERYRLAQDLDAKAGTGRELSLHEYIGLVKKSMGRIGVRTQMLQDLSLGEDIGLGVTDLPAAPPPPPPPNPRDPEAKTTGNKEAAYTGAMCATSLVVKKARRLAGLMHIEQQTIDLREIYDWLQHLANLGDRRDDSIAGEGSPGVDSKGGQEAKSGDWRLPSSPAMALLYAQEDLRQRLAHLYQEKNTLENRREQLQAAKRLVGKVGDAEEAKLQNYIHGLQALEEGYETLGGKIADNLDDASTLDKRFQKLTEKEEDSKDEGQTKKKGKKKKKGGKDGKRGGKKGKSGSEAEDTEDEAHRGGGSDAEDAVKSDSEGEEKKGKKKGKKSESEGDGEDEGYGMKGSRKKKIKLSSASASAEVANEATTAEVSVEAERTPTSPKLSLIGEFFKERQRVVTQEMGVQTDDAALFSLMESMMDDYVDDTPVGPEDEATELRRLRREAKKLKVQLRFWRSRNWVEQHHHLMSNSTSSSPPALLPVDSSPSEAGFAFYFNSVRHPGLSVHGSAPSNLTGHGIGFASNETNSMTGGPASAPSTLTSRPGAPSNLAGQTSVSSNVTGHGSIPSSLVGHASESTNVTAGQASVTIRRVDPPRLQPTINLRLLSNAGRMSTRPTRTWSRIPPESSQPAFPPNSLVIFGRSSTLQTPRESHSLQSHEPRSGNVSPRRSGMHFQKA